MADPTMSMRLVHPFVAAAKRKGVDPGMLRFLEHSDRDARMLASTAVGLLRIAVSLTQDEGLGLEAALETSAGDYGDLEYASGSCATVGEALDFLCRHYFVMDEAATLEYSCSGGRVHVFFRQPKELHSRASADFALAMLYLSYVRWVGTNPLEYEVRFPYPEPEDLEPYRRVFGPATKLCFSAQGSGVSFPEADLKLTLRHSDAKLHGLLSAYLRQRHAGKRSGDCLVDTTRRHIVEKLPQGQVRIDEIAALMGMSRRTLARKLEDQGTTFKQLLCDVRCASAVRYLLLEGFSVHQISDQLGYSEPAAFHRAFRGWFGQTPSAYRRRQLLARTDARA
jgi:AraC-like DNA-binding protein